MKQTGTKSRSKCWTTSKAKCPTTHRKSSNSPKSSTKTTIYPNIPLQPTFSTHFPPIHLPINQLSPTPNPPLPSHTTTCSINGISPKPSNINLMSTSEIQIKIIRNLRRTLKSLLKIQYSRKRELLSCSSGKRVLRKGSRNHYLSRLQMQSMCYKITLNK